MRRSPYFPYLLLAVAVLFWAGNWVFARALRNDVPPVALAFWRWVVALVILTPFALRYVARQWDMIAGAWRLLALLACLATVFQHIPVYIGLRETTATNGALLNSITPVFILMLSRGLHGERWSNMQVLGVVTSLAGVLVILSAGDMSALARLQLNRGDLWVLVATLAWAIYTVCLRRRPPQLNLLAMLWVISAIGIVAMAPFYAWEIAVGRTFNPTPLIITSLLYIGALSTVVSYVFWNRAVHQVGANRAGPFMYLMLVYTPLLAIIFIGERLHLYHLTGCVLILGGIYLTTRGSPVAAPPDL